MVESVTPLTSFTPRQQEVLDCILSGWTNKQIAEELGIGYQTAKERVSRLYKHVGVSSRAKLILWALERNDKFENRAQKVALK